MSKENPWEQNENSSLEGFLEDFKKMWQKGKKKPSGSSSTPTKKRNFFIFLIPIIIVFLVFKSFYQVEAGEKGIVLRVGKYYKTTDSGLNFLIPYIEQVIVVDIGNYS